MTPVQTEQPAAAPAAATLDGKALLDRMMEESARERAKVASRYQPVMEIDDFVRRQQALEKLKDSLISGVDYTTLEGVEKPFLTKAGAQKACVFFGYVPNFTPEETIEDWAGVKFGEPLFYYRYKCKLVKDGAQVGEGVGSCNSWESKYRYRWVKETDVPMRYTAADVEQLPQRETLVTEFAFAIDKKETTGQYGKPLAYWQEWEKAIASGEARKVTKETRSGKKMEAWERGGIVYRVPNEQFPDVINTCQKQAQKRAYVEATLSATGLSQFFTQDEDTIPEHDLPTGKPAAAPAGNGGNGGSKPGPTPAAAGPRSTGKPAQQPLLTREVPEELSIAFADLDRGNLKALQGLYETLEKDMIAADSQRGGAEYDRVAKAFGEKYPRGTSDVNAHKDCLLDLWDALQALRATAPAVA